jgi:hypothetical protein
MYKKNFRVLSSTIENHINVVRIYCGPVQQGALEAPQGMLGLERAPEATCVLDVHKIFFDNLGNKTFELSISKTFTEDNDCDYVMNTVVIENKPDLMVSAHGLLLLLKDVKLDAEIDSDLCVLLKILD